MSPDGLERTCEWGYTPSHIDPCELDFAPAPAFDEELGYILDTDEGLLTDKSGAMVNVDLNEEGQGDGVVIAIWAVESFDFTGADLRIEGTRALLIASDSDLIIRGNLDLRGVGDRQAAGANHLTACDGSRGVIGGAAGVGAGGGGGAGAEAAGAPGQTGSNGAGGSAGSSLSLLTVRGGCDGGDGGDGGGAGGAAGGGLHLAARSMVRVDAVINAGGGGGGPGLDAGNGAGAAGGGGGSGGKIGIEAPAVELSSVTRLIATGGAGGGGAAANGTPGEPGESARLDGLAAVGGAGGDDISAAGGPGGSGGIGSTPPTTAVGTAAGAGGGGGGAAGRVLVRSETLSDLAQVIAPALRTAAID